MGIVKKNSILLVEYAEHVREHERRSTRSTAMQQGRAAPPAAHPHDDRRDDDVRGAADPRPRAGHRDAKPDGRRRPRRAHGLDGPEPPRRPAFYVVTDRIKRFIFKPKPKPPETAAEPAE